MGDSKGRLNRNEMPLESAIREFEEETGVKRSDYRLLPNEGTISIHSLMLGFVISIFII